MIFGFDLFDNQLDLLGHSVKFCLDPIIDIIATGNIS